MLQRSHLERPQPLFTRILVDGSVLPPSERLLANALKNVAFHFSIGSRLDEAAGLDYTFL